MIKNKSISPIVKWVGGKRQLLPEIVKRIPNTFSYYAEPFVGGGAVFFELQPKKAIINEGQLNGIYVVGDDEVAILRWLRLGKTFGDQVEVLSGLSIGDQYVVEAEDRLYNGSKVSIK